jgi:hypothetical protein
MTTKAEIIKSLKTEYPTLRTGSDEAGYLDMTPAEYDATIENWATNQLEQDAQIAEAEATTQAKLDAIDKLTALGIDPKAFGL